MKSFVLAKDNIRRSVHRRACGDSTTKRNLGFTRKEHYECVCSRNAFHCEDETEESDFKYGYLNSNSEIDDSVEQISSVLNELLELTEIEKTCQLLGR